MFNPGKSGIRMYRIKESEYQQSIAFILLSGIPIMWAVVAAPIRKLNLRIIFCEG